MAYLMYDITSVLFSFLSIQPRLSAVAFHLEIAMTKTDRPNRDALSAALDIYRDAMRPFIVRHLKRVRGKGVEDVIGESLHDRQAEQFRRNLAQGRSIEDAIDINDFPNLISRQWHAVFKQAFGDDRTVQSLLWMIAKIRNEVAHPNTQDMDAEYARSRLYDIADVLGRINASDAKRDVEGIRDRLVSESAPRDAPSESENAKPARKSRASNLKPWRDVMPPSSDVALGTFQEAEFAADLQQVHDGRALASEYGNPVNFFRQTYITPGIRTLLVNALKRLSGNGGDPVIQTKTGFGGGKTHSLIALYHLVNSADAVQSNREIGDLIAEAGLPPHDIPQTAVAVLDGTHLAPTDTRTTPSGDPRNALWGEMAYQLGGQAAYDIIGQAAREGTAPGGAQLDELFRTVGPSLILMDELVAYVRNVPSDREGSVYTFLQALGQSVSRAADVVLVITLPESDMEVGGEAGQKALARLEHIFGRIEAVWEPLEVGEAFAVVRRRLFGDKLDEAERDRTCEAFSRMYGQNRAEYPSGVSEARYLQRLKDCYPIHPEIFERLYADWSSIPQFQRTRGVLRMMANGISYLYRQNEAGPLIMPATLPLRNASLGNEFARLLPGQWQAVLSEVDSDHSQADRIDATVQRFAEVGGAARRLARAIFLGSAPSGAVKGIDLRQIHLGVVKPGDGISAYNDALQRMVGDLYYLYTDDDRYYFHAEENLNKVATDRAEQLSDRDIAEFIVRELGENVGQRREVLICPATSAAVPDDDWVRLVILHPSQSLPSRTAETDEATPVALDILQNRGPAPHVHRNTLLFLTAKNDDLRNLRANARTYLAWDSIIGGDRRIANLTGDRLRQARSSLAQAREEMDAALVRAYRWGMAPTQANPQRADYGFSTFETDSEDTGEIVDSAFEKFIAQEALADAISPVALASMLAQYVWKNDPYRDHIAIDTLWELLTSHVYLHRLRNETVLMDCIKRGVQARNFGYAESYQNEAYHDLRFGGDLPDFSAGVAEGGSGLLVNPVMAQLVKEETPEEAVPPPTESAYAVPQPPGDETPPPSAPRGPKRITATKTMQGEISLDDVNLLREEIVRNLREDGGEITVEITIRAHKADGFSESTARAVRENSVQLDLAIDEAEG